jgi:DNA-binding LacI/PurR family transcriptional regulator
MDELAAMAKVSRSAVSLVLNGKAEGRIARAKRERIQELIKSCNFQPNRAARNLRNQRHYTIGIAMPVPFNRFYSDMMIQLQSGLNKRGYSSFFVFWNTGDDIPNTYNTLREQGCDGIIAWDPSLMSMIRGIPAVYYGDPLKLAGTDHVRLDFENVIRKSLEYLTSLGHRRIGFAGHFDDPRFRVLQEFSPEFGLEFNPDYSCHVTREQLCTHQEIKKRLKQLKQPPTAVIAANDGIAYIVADIAESLKIPLSVIGFNNTDEGNFRKPAMTTFNTHNEAVADALIDLVLRRIEHPDITPEGRIIPTEMIIRNSCFKTDSNHKE